ncbi:GP46-like surface antigen, putative [Bodo saltans]|uniref:GP46-like surface antigen, putative n=1 Tax=Bodo saltans TaxID=75058 RepID=A0A0S4J746_BODSA|nr:GP46-like surface antigen, putative [Bodo saltans]|eukprot:CUG87271.1 GP46-like surface antigen, putative [Bodo saltans]
MKNNMTLFLLPLLFCSLDHATASLISSERTALIAFYNNTGGPSWTLSPTSPPPTTDWTGGLNRWSIANATVDPCVSWYGVACTNNIVTTLAVVGVQASGTLPDGLFTQFEGLLVLDLSDNKLSGVLPSLPNTIQRLRLVSNFFSGTLPDTYGLLSIIELKLDNNSLSGTLPSSFGVAWPFIIMFTIPANQFSGTLPSTWANWQLLQTFDVGTNNLGGTLPAVFGAGWGSSLGNFSSRRNNFSGTLPPEYCNWSNIELFQVDNNPFVGTLPAVYGPSFRRIVNVLISNTHISGSIPNEWGNWAATVVSIQLYMNSLSGTLPPSFGNFSRLSSLNFAMNNFPGEVPVAAWSPSWCSVYYLSRQPPPLWLDSCKLEQYVYVRYICWPPFDGVHLPLSDLCSAASALPFGYGCIPVSVIPLLETVDESNMEGVLAQMTWLPSVACNASVAPSPLPTPLATPTRTLFVPENKIHNGVVPTQSEIQRVTTASAAMIGTTIVIRQLVPSSVGGAGSMHAFQATTVVQHLRQLCLVASVAGQNSDDGSSTGNDNSVCCDGGTSPTQMSVGSGVSEAPLAGAIIGNTILVVAISGARLLVQYLLVRKFHLHFSGDSDACASDLAKDDDNNSLVVQGWLALVQSVLQTMAQLTHGGIVASLWVPFTALFTPTVAAGIAIMSLSESGGGVLPWASLASWCGQCLGLLL